MKIESNKNWTTCLRLNTGDGSPRVFLLNSHFLGSVPRESARFIDYCNFSKSACKAATFSFAASSLSALAPM